MKNLNFNKTDGVAHIEINNPPINLLTIELINELNELLLTLNSDRDIKAVVFQSSIEGFFLAHLDLTLINGTHGGQSGCVEFSHMISNIKSLKQLSIAIVDGVARGGGDEFVMACDLAYGTENAIFAQPELYINIPTGGQGAVQYARRMGRNKALEALLTGMDYSPQEAEKLNILTRYLPKTELDQFLKELLLTVTNWEVRDILMYKEITSTSILSEGAGAELELRYFLERAKEEKTQTIISTYLKHGGQTRKEAKNIQDIFAATAKELEGKF